MNKRFELPEEISFAPQAPTPEQDAERALKNLRYVVASVNGDALRAWADLWEELKGGVTPAGAVLPEMQNGFTPSCGWAQFLENFWLLKHYLDYVDRFCKGR